MLGKETRHEERDVQGTLRVPDHQPRRHQHELQQDRERRDVAEDVLSGEAMSVPDDVDRVSEPE